MNFLYLTGAFYLLLHPNRIDGTDALDVVLKVW